MVVLGGWVESMILEVFSNLWFYDSKYSRQFATENQFSHTVCNLKWAMLTFLIHVLPSKDFWRQNCECCYQHSEVFPYHLFYLCEWKTWVTQEVQWSPTTHCLKGCIVFMWKGEGREGHVYVLKCTFWHTIRKFLKVFPNPSPNNIQYYKSHSRVTLPIIWDESRSSEIRESHPDCPAEQLQNTVNSG